MKVSLYSTLWGYNPAAPHSFGFDFKDALSNWLVYADEVVISCGDDATLHAIQEYTVPRALPVVLTRTAFDFQNDPLAYGKTENAAMQACTGDLLLQANMDERWGSTLLTKANLIYIGQILNQYPEPDSYFIPTIDLYGSTSRYCTVNRKWYMARNGRGLKRGAVSFAMKPDGHIDYDKSSSDELLRSDGSLATTAALIGDLSLPSLTEYVNRGMPLVYHLGFLDLNSRARRAAWWSDFWVRATGGDPNNHITDVAELEKRHTFEHGLPLWPTINLDSQPQDSSIVSS